MSPCGKELKKACLHSNNKQVEDKYTVVITIKDGKGVAVIKEAEASLGKMELSFSDDDLFVHHTVINEDQEGKGLAKILLGELVNYARQREWKVVPLCSYVVGQFKRYPAAYSDIWKKK